MYTSKEFVEFVKSMDGAPYWYGTCCYKATQSLLTTKKQQYPKQYKGYAAVFREAIENGAVVCDCVGLIKGFFWSEGGKRVYNYRENGGNLTLKYASCINDYGANGLFNYSKKSGKWGSIDTIPNVPGLVLWKNGHVGVYLGDGLCQQASWMNTGCYRCKVSDTKFTHWGYLPNLDYGEQAEEPVKETKTIEYTVVKGDTLWKLAQKYYGSGTKWTLIKEANNLTGSTIYIGQVLKIEGVTV